MAVTDSVNRQARRFPAWPLYLAALAAICWIYYRGLTGGLGVDPVKKIERQLGEWALWLLIAGLAATPLRRHAGLNLMPFRRAIGLCAFFMAVAHFLTWLVFDIQFLWGQIGQDILKRPYITVGVAAFLLLIPLALTSTDKAIRRLGPLAWRRLHRLVYPAAILAGLHYLWLAKGFQLAPIAYLAAILGLLALRLRRRPRRAAA